MPKYQSPPIVVKIIFYLPRMKKDEAVMGLKFSYWFLSFSHCLNAENMELLASTAAVAGWLLNTGNGASMT